MLVITLIATVGLLMALMAAWIEVQRAARRMAEQHPESGPLRLVGGGCGGVKAMANAAAKMRARSQGGAVAASRRSAARGRRGACRRLRGLRQHGLQARRAGGARRAELQSVCPD